MHFSPTKDNLLAHISTSQAKNSVPTDGANRHAESMFRKESKRDTT